VACGGTACFGGAAGGGKSTDHTMKITAERTKARSNLFSILESCPFTAPDHDRRDERDDSAAGA
jgi:hypothetical protein